LTDDKPTSTPNHRTVATLLALTPVGTLFSLVATYVGYIADQIGSEASFLFYCCAVLLILVPAVWLIVATVKLGRETPPRKGLRVWAASVAGLSLIVGGVVIGPLIAEPIGEAIDLAIDQLEPPTDAELAYSPSELERAVEDTITESLAGIPQTYDEPFIHAETCRLSNRRDGVLYTSFVHVNLDIQSMTRWDEARDPIVANWERMGFSIEPAAYPTNDLRTYGIGPIDWIGLDELGPVASLRVHTVCVDGTAQR
jgi:hypothetical protein